MLQVAGVGAGSLKGPQNGNPTSNLQMAADRTCPYSLRRWHLRYSLSLRDVEELLDERAASRPYDRVALGAAVRSRAGAAHPAASQAD